MPEIDIQPDKLLPADSFYSTRLDRPVLLRNDYKGEQLAYVKPQSMYTVFKNTAMRAPQRTALGIKFFK